MGSIKLATGAYRWELTRDARESPICDKTDFTAEGTETREERICGAWDLGSLCVPFRGMVPALVFARW